MIIMAILRGIEPVNIEIHHPLLCEIQRATGEHGNAGFDGGDQIGDNP